MSLSSSSSPSRRSFTVDSNDIMICDICLEPYDEGYREAKFLICHHSFCEVCLQQVARNQDSIECPNCRKVTDLGRHGVEGLQTNFYICSMRDTLNRLGIPKAKGCQKHSNQVLSFFCHKCSEPICRDCVVIDHKETDGHGIQDISQAESEQRKDLNKHLNDAKQQLSKLQLCIQHLKAESANLQVAKKAIMKDIDIAFDKYAKTLLARKAYLQELVCDKYNATQGILMEKTETLATHLKDMGTMIEQGERVIRKSPVAEVVCAKSGLLGCTEAVDIQIASTVVGNNFVQFDSEIGFEDFDNSVGHIGDITCSAPLPTKVKFSPKTLMAGLESKVTMQVFTFSGECLDHYPMSVQIRDPTATIIPCKVTADEQGLYNVLFQPQMFGEHVFMATFLDQPIPGTETMLSIPSNNPVQIIGRHGSGNGKFHSPRAIALDRDGNLFVADTGNKLIQQFDYNGKFTKQFRIDNGKEDCSTCDLALNKARNIIVCTETAIGSGMNPTMGSTVTTYNTEGVLQQMFVNKLMKCALCVATNSQGHILVSDYLVHTLFMYDDKGQFLRRIGNAGTFNHPAFIAVGKDDCIIVSDTNNDCVQVFDKAGNFQYQFGSSGSGKGQLKQPFGVDTDGEHIIVVDSGNHRIQVFKMDGTFISVVDSADHPLDQPRGVALSNDGHFFVADRDNHCIKKYRFLSDC